MCIFKGESIILKMALLRMELLLSVVALDAQQKAVGYWTGAMSTIHSKMMSG